MFRISLLIVSLAISVSATAQQSCFSRLKSYATPQNFELGSMGGFYTTTQIYEQLDSMQLLYPNLVTIKSNIGTYQSVEGRPLYYVEITNLLDSANHKPQVLFTSLHHAMEPMSMQQLIFFMYYLLENYNTNPEINYLINNLEIYFVPVVNPDGYEYNISTNPNGGGTWRKNRRDNGFTTGVDLNRNYGVAFGYDEIGSSSLGWHPWYRGDSAFSEPETQAMKYFLEHHTFQSAVNWHAYGNYLIYPWNYSSAYTPDSITYESLCKQLVYESNYVYGTCYETYGYQSNGDADDWAYQASAAKNSILSLTAETGTSDDGFWPTQSRIIELCKEALPLNLAMLRLNLHFAKIHDLSSSVLSQSSGFLKYKIQNIGLKNPSSYTVQFNSLTAGFIVDTSPKQYTSLQKLDEISDSISYSISLSNPSQIKYVISVNNGSFTYTDTIVKYFGPGSLYFSDSCSNMDNFTGNDWGISANYYYSYPSSFNESPAGNYSIFQQSELSIDTLIDLTNAIYANVNFFARWILENNYDYVQLLSSIDNGSTWAPLCGKYSEIASADEPTGQAVWDAIQKDWVLEDISLADYIGQQVRLKFSFYADQSNTRDGFYFDDINIHVINDSAIFIANPSLNNNITIWPNPVIDYLYVRSGNNENIRITVTDLLGNIVQQATLPSSGEINFKNIPQGLYLVTVWGNNFVLNKKIVKYH